MDAELELEFRAFVEARAQVLFRSALALTGHRQQAEDLLQTILAKGAQHWSRIRENNPRPTCARRSTASPDDEIAEFLDCTESTVRSQIVRVLARLRALCPELAPTVAESVWDQ